MLQTLKILREQFDRKVIIGTAIGSIEKIGNNAPGIIKRNYLFLFL
jgi:hypothetical protein